MTSACIEHEPCPRCRTLGRDMHGDNLGVYTDGHKYCFSCGYYVPGDPLHKLREDNNNSNDLTRSYSATVDSFSTEAITYLKSFGLTNKEIEDNFKPHEDGYVFSGNGWYEVRRLNKLPKVLTHGPKRGNEPVWLNLESTTIIIVEDVVSAIKVSRVANCVALLGSHIPLELLMRLSKRFKTCGVWLDPDKARESILQAGTAKWIFKDSYAILSDKDPKYYSTEEIRQWMNKKD